MNEVGVLLFTLTLCGLMIWEVLRARKIFDQEHQAVLEAEQRDAWPSPPKETLKGAARLTPKIRCVHCLDYTPRGSDFCAMCGIPAPELVRNNPILEGVRTARRNTIRKR